MQYTQAAGLAGLAGSPEFAAAATAAAAGASPQQQQQYTYPGSPQQSPTSPQQQQQQQGPGSPRSPAGSQHSLPSPTHQQPPAGQPSPTHSSMLPSPQDQPLALIQQPPPQQQNQQQANNNKIPDIVLTGSTATTLADLEEILSCRESTLHGQYSLTNIYISMFLFAIYFYSLFVMIALFPTFFC